LFHWIIDPLEEDTYQTEAMKKRTRGFAILAVRLLSAWAKTGEGRSLGKKGLQSRTSVAANNRAVRRARSKQEFIAKMSIGAEETDEIASWMESLVETGIVRKAPEENLLSDANELTAIFAPSQRTAKGRSQLVGQWFNEPMIQSYVRSC
jgi:four helix bundle protein